MRLPQRQQLTHFRMKNPPGGLRCTRPGKYGNPFPISDTVTRDASLKAFRKYVELWLEIDTTWLMEAASAKYLLCTCRLDKPCHVDVLIELMMERNKPVPINDDTLDAT